MTTFLLTWPQAHDLALSGKLVRRESWTHWLRHTTGLWEIVDATGTLLRVVAAGDFSAPDFQANDWTTDPIGTVRDVCLVDPPSYIKTFVPPSSSAKIDFSQGIIVTLGPSVPSGSYQLRAYLNGDFVGFAEVYDNSTTTIPCAFPTYGVTYYARVVIVSRLPLPTWANTIRAEAYLEDTRPPGFAVTSLLDASALNIIPGGANASLTYAASYLAMAASAGITLTNTLSRPVTLVVTGSADDDVMFNGAVYQPDTYFYTYGGLVYWSWNAVGRRNAAHGFSYTTTLAPWASLLIQGQDNGAGGSISATVTVS